MGTLECTPSEFQAADGLTIKVSNIGFPAEHRVVLTLTDQDEQWFRCDAELTREQARALAERILRECE